MESARGRGVPSGAWRRRLRGAALVLLAALAAPVAADAVSRNYQVRDDDAARAAIRQFRTYSSRSEWRAAIQELQRLFDTPPQRGVVVAVEDSSPQRYESCWRAALRLFDSLPAEGRATWEELERRQAEELLDRGLRFRRDEDLAAAARRFPARDVRRRAHDALAHLAMARGDFDRAARELESLLDCADPGEEPSVHARLLFARAQMGDAEGSARAALLAKPFLTATVPTPWGPERLSDFAERMQARASAAAPRFAGARLFGGDRHGSGLSDAPPQCDSPGWRDSVTTGFERGKESDDFDFRTRADATFRPVVPLVAQGSVFVNDGLALTARDVATGRQVWRYETPQRTPQWRDNPNAYSACAWSEGVVYAPLATRYDAPLDVDREFYNRIIIYALPHRALHAFDARTGDLLWCHDSAHLLGRADAKQIEEESVATAPLVVGDDVIVLTWKFNTRYEARLVCFDRTTGATRWRTSLVHAQQETNLFGRPVKELVAPPPAELDGVVYASTGLGIAAAVDRVTGGVVWLAEYETTEIPQTSQWYETRDRDVTWRPSPISATRQAVVMAPLESGYLFFFNPRTGEQINRRPCREPGASATWFLGVTGGRAYALGTKVFAMDLATGRDAWDARKSPDAGRLAKQGVSPQPALGRGILTTEGVYVPTLRGIVRVDLATGAAGDARDLPRGDNERRPRLRTDGDLVAADGALVVATDRSIDCYYRFEDLRDRLNARLIASPEDPQLRLEAGEIFRSAGNLAEAISCLEHGLRSVEKLPPGSADRTDLALRRALSDALVARARARRSAGDGPGAIADLRRAVGVARERGDVVRALFALADCAAAVALDAECDAALRRVATEFADVQTQVDGDARIDAGALAAFRLAQRAADRGDLAAAVDGWMRLLDERPDAVVGDRSVTTAVRDALAALQETQGAAAEKLVTARARKDLDLARASKDTAALQRLARTSPSPVVAAEAAVAAATLHRAASRPREATAVLEGLVARPQPPAVLGKALWLLAQVYRDLAETPRERAALRRIVQEAADAPLDDGRRAGDAAAAELRDARFADAPAPLPDPRPPLALAWESLGGTDDPPMILIQVQGARPRALEGRLLFLVDRTVRCVEGRDGSEVWKTDSRVACREAFGTATGVVLVGDDADARPRTVRVEKLDAATGTRARSWPLPGQYLRSASALGMVYVLSLRVNERGEQIAWLTAVSADSLEKVAERELGSGIHPQITCAADAVVLYELIPQGSTARRRVITLDGATLAPRGLVEIEGHISPFSVAPPGTAVVVTTSRADGIAGIDATTGSLAWPTYRLRGRSVKNLLAVPGGVIVTDDGDQVRRIDAKTGAETWVRPLAGDGRSLGYNGEAADGDLVVVTLVTNSAADTADPAVAVAIDAATGEVRWRTPLPVQGRTLPRPDVLQGVVAYDLNVRRSSDRSDGYDCRVVYLARDTGAVVGTIAHPTVGRYLQRSFHQGRFAILWAPPRADVAVYAGAESGK